MTYIHHVTHACTLQCKQWQRRRAWGSRHVFFIWQFPLKMLHPRVTWLMYIMPDMMLVTRILRIRSWMFHKCTHVSFVQVNWLKYIMSHMCAPTSADNNDGVGNENRDTYASYTNTNTLWVRTCLIRTSDMTGWCSFCHLIKNSLAPLLEALFTRIYIMSRVCAPTCTSHGRHWRWRRAWGPRNVFFIWQFPLKMLHPNPRNPPNPGTHIYWYAFK